LAFDPVEMCQQLLQRRLGERIVQAWRASHARCSFVQAVLPSRKIRP